jgi:hypothetical protein
MSSHRARALPAPWWRPALAVLLGLLALAATTDVADPAVRVVALLLFLVFGPGLALVGLLGMDEPWREAALVIGVSLAVDLVLLTALAYNGGRSAGDGLAVLLGVTVLGAAAQVVLSAVRRRGEGRAE